MQDLSEVLETQFRQPRRVVALAAFAAYLLLPTEALQAEEPAQTAGRCESAGRLSTLCAKGQSALYVCVRDDPCGAAKELKPRGEKSRFWLLRRLFI